jgi:Ca-activated chloride channel homolog
MNLLAPGALAFSLLAVPIILLYMLRLRRREMPVSSAMLWQLLLRDRQSNTPWQKLRRQLLLFLQLLILAAMVLALARPAQPVPSLVSGSALILLDGSASMLASDVAPTRFDAARKAALDAVEALPENTPVTVILAGIQPRVLASNETDRASLRRALNAAQAEPGSANWPAAFAITASAYTSAAGASATRPTILLISDGGIASATLPGLPGEVRYLMMGKSGENLGITALAVRATGGNASAGADASANADGAQIFANVHNYGSQGRSAILSFYAGDALIEARQVEIAPGGDQSVILNVKPDGPQRYNARLSNLSAQSALDAFPLDDRAYAIYRPAAGGKVLLATRGNLFLRQLLSSLPGVKSAVVIAGENALGTADGAPAGTAVPDPTAATPVDIPKSGYDVTILDGLFPTELPAGQLLLINPPENPLFTVTGIFQVSGATRILDHPLTRFLSWENVHVRQARQVTLPEWAEPLVTTDAGPLVFAGEVKQGAARRRVAVITFDLHDSDLPLQIAFPVLFSNLLQYLSPTSSLSAAGVPVAGNPVSDSSGVAIQPGGSVLIRPATDLREFLVQAPGGQSYRLQPEEGQALFTQAAAPGFYTVTYPDHAEMGTDAFAVNLFSPDESTILPRGTLQIGQTAVAPTTPAAIGQRELWPWAAALALIVLLLEWWLYHRQQSTGGSVEPWETILWMLNWVKRPRKGVQRRS